MPFAWTSSFHNWYLQEFIGQALMSSASESLPSIIANDDPPALGDSEGEVADAGADNGNYDEELDEELPVGDAVLPSDFMEACGHNAKARQVPSRSSNGSTGFASSRSHLLPFLVSGPGL